MMIASLFIDGWMLHKLAPHFHRTVSFDRALSTVANAAIPGFIVWALGIIPGILSLRFLAFMYGFYIMFAGFDKMIELNPNAPKNDTKLSFFSAALCFMLIIHIVMHALVEPMTPSPFFDIAQ
jgi:hypothetical protein